MSISYRALLCAPLLLIPFTAHAEETPEEAQDRRTVVVTARALPAPEQEPLRTPGGVDVVEAEEFADRLAVSLRDALAFSPGVYLQPRFGQEVRISIRGSGLSRGFHMRGLMLFQDGVPINLADNNGDFQELDPQVFERLTVYRGGNALRLGGSTLGGAIDAQTPTGRSAPGLDLRLDGGSFNTVRAKIAYGGADDRGDAFVALTGDTSSGDRAHADRRAIRFNGNVGLRLSDRVETRFYASANAIAQDLPGALTAQQALTDPAQSLPVNVLNDQARDITSIRLQNRTTLDLGATRLAGGVFLNAKQLYHPIFQVIDQGSTDYGAFVRLETGGTVGGVGVEASAGAMARANTVQARQFVNVGGRRGALTADAVQQATTIDAYAELRLRPTQALSLIGGAVLTHGIRDVDNLRTAQRSGRATFNQLSPRIGLLFEPSGDVQLFANYSRSHELPGFSEVNQVPFAVGGVVAPGFVDLDPQRAWTIEIGTRGSAGPVRWDVTAYRADIRGELLQFDQGPGVLAATFNAGRTRHQGVEAGLGLTLSPWLALRGVWQWSDFTFRGDRQFDDNRLPVVPEHAIRGEATIGTDRLSVSPVVEWVPRGAFADYRNTTRVPGYALLGASARARLDDRFTLFVDARNLTGRKAIGDISAVVGATAASAIYYPVERRAVYGGVRVTL